MSSVDRQTSREEPLNDSWVELHFQQQRSHDSPSRTPPHPALSQPIHIHNGQMEKLLLEAQRDGSRGSSRNASTTSSRGSPKSPHSPNNEPAGDISTIQEGETPEAQEVQDWIWDWSSRPEAIPPSEYNGRFKHPRRTKLSVRNTQIMRNGIFNLENLPTLLLTHAATFIMGAAVMFIYLKKYCRWAVIATQPMD